MTWLSGQLTLLCSARRAGRYATPGYEGQGLICIGPCGFSVTTLPPSGPRAPCQSSAAQKEPPTFPAQIRLPAAAPPPWLLPPTFHGVQQLPPDQLAQPAPSATGPPAGGHGRALVCASPPTLQVQVSGTSPQEDSDGAPARTAQACGSYSNQWAAVPVTPVHSPKGSVPLGLHD